MPVRSITMSTDSLSARSALTTIDAPASNGSSAASVDPSFVAETLGAIAANIATVLHGKDTAIELTLLCMAAEGHLLVEDVPGVGKTLLAKALARSIAGDTSRVQFTPDLLPSDLTGVTMLEQSTGRFSFRQGPLFANVVLCDELNRASPKVQAALLEAMEERQVTVDGTTHVLPHPFMVVATQNPFEQEGTYPLPESQLDRFLVRTALGYPDRAAEIAVLDSHARSDAVASVGPVATLADIATITHMVARIHVAPVLQGYVVDVLRSTRAHGELRLGASPRAGLGWLRLGRARAAMRGRDYVTPDDLHFVAPAVLGHRLLPVAGGASSADVLADVLSTVAVPGSRRG